jgi:AcrR family transcriptional regulator
LSQNSGDLRVRRTQKLLREALIALIEEQSFDTITVGEIAERAMVSRAAFYRYYQDKYDLVEKIFEEAMDTLIREMDLRGSTVVGECASEPWIALLDQGVQMERTPDPLVRLFNHFATYERLYCALLGAKGSSWFQTKVRAFLADVLKERTQGLRVFPNSQSVKENHMMVSGVVFPLLAGLLIDAITWWLEHGRPSPPRSMATFCFRLILANLREVSQWE